MIENPEEPCLKDYLISVRRKPFLDNSALPEIVGREECAKALAASSGTVLTNTFSVLSSFLGVDPHRHKPRVFSPG